MHAYVYSIVTTFHAAMRQLPESRGTVCLMIAAGVDVNVAEARHMVRMNLLGNTLSTIAFFWDTGITFIPSLVITSPRDITLDPMITARLDESEMRTLAAMVCVGRPLTLKRLAANVIRLRLRPNAIVGAKKLPLPSGFNRKYINFYIDI